MRTCFRWIVSVLLLGTAVSCVTPRRLSYLRDMEYDKVYSALPAPELVIQPGDMLGIKVSSDTPLLAAPFNSAIPSGGGESSISSSTPVYTVNASGSIQFPVLGTLPVMGKTTRQVEREITDRIISMGYIKEPVVNVELSNFTVTVLGSAGNRLVESKGPSLNLLQVVAQTSGASERTKIKDVMVIRTENGQRIAYQVNLQKTSLFDSPVFYLRQNDVVYIKPRGYRLDPAASMVISLIGTTLTLSTAIMNYFLWRDR